MKSKTNSKLKKDLMPLDEALSLLPQVSTSKFVGSVDIDILLNLKTKNKEVIKGSVQLPHKVGKEKVVYVICDDNQIKEAIEAGADKAGLDIINEIAEGKINFDILIATPSVMSKIVHLAKILGPKGLMPNPKNGTVSENLVDTISSFKQGKINFKTIPNQPVVRMKIGNLNMPQENLKNNLLAVCKAVYSETKKYSSNPFKKITISPTMGAGLKIDINDIISYI